MMLRRRCLVIALALVATLVLAACGGGDDDGTVTGTVPSNEPEAPSAGGPAPRAFSGLPPSLVECFADEGFDLSSPTAIHSAPQRVVNKCFGELHQGGGFP